MNTQYLKAGLSRAVMLVVGLIAAGIALMTSFYLAVATIFVVLLTFCFATVMQKKPVRVKSKAQRSPIEGECRVVRRR